MKRRNIFLIILILTFSVLGVYIFSETGVLTTDERPENIYVMQGFEVKEVNGSTFDVNRTLNLNGTAIQATYNDKEDTLYAGSGVNNSVSFINTLNFTTDGVYRTNDHNVQDIRYDFSSNRLYTSSTDTTIRKFNKTSMNQTGGFNNHEGAVFQIELSEDGNYIYSASHDNYVHKINTNTMESAGVIRDFPEGLPSIAYGENRAYYGGQASGIYSVPLNYTGETQYSNMTNVEHTNLYYNTSSSNLSSSERAAEGTGIIRMTYNSENNAVYVGTSDGILYKLDADDLEVIDSYDIESNTERDFNYSNYETPWIQNGEYEYGFDVRSVTIDKNEEYVYIVVAPGILIELEEESLKETRRKYIDIGYRIVDVEVSG